jgi:hypothetical protein
MRNQMARLLAALGDTKERLWARLFKHTVLGTDELEQLIKVQPLRNTVASEDVGDKLSQSWVQTCDKANQRRRSVC